MYHLHIINFDIDFFEMAFNCLLLRCLDYF